MRRCLWLAVAGAFLVLAATSAGGSRSGNRIVFVTNHLCSGRAEDCGRAEIATIGSGGTGTAILTRNGVSEAAPAWSANRALIAFFRRSAAGRPGRSG